MDKRFKPILPAALSQICAYCGASAAHRDHVVPWSHAQRPDWVPACKDCNGLLGPAVHFTWGERCQYLKDQYARKWRHVDGYDYEELLEGTRGTLRARLKRERRLQAELHRRSDWLQTMISCGGELDLWRLTANSDEAYALGELLKTLDT